MVSASPNDQKFSRYPLVLKLNVTLALYYGNSIFFKWKILSDDRRLYFHDSKWNSRSDVDGLTHTKQLLNLLCIVYCLLLYALQTLLYHDFAAFPLIYAVQ